MPESDEVQHPVILDEDEVEVRVKDMKHAHAADFKVIYADSAGLTINFYGLSIIFGQVIPARPGISGGPAEMIVEERVHVTMSVEHARALADVLQEHVQKYEEKHGPVRRKKP